MTKKEVDSPARSIQSLIYKKKGAKQIPYI